MGYQGYCINLDRDTLRRTRVEAELARIGGLGRYRRFPGVDGATCGISSPQLQPGEIGCFLSHLGVLEQHLGDPVHVHVIEDDVIFAGCALPAIDQTLLQGALEVFDILFLDILMPPHAEGVGYFKGLYDEVKEASQAAPGPLPLFRVVDLVGTDFYCTASYLVSARALSKVSALLRAHLDKGLMHPVDIVIRNAVHRGQLRAGCLFPFVTSLDLETTMISSIDGRAHGPFKHRHWAAMRQSFFVDCDLEAVLRFLPEESRCEAGDPHSSLLLSAFKGLLLGGGR